MLTSTPISNKIAKAKDGKPGKQPRKSNTPFQRIKIDGVTFADERLKDNSFAARVSSYIYIYISFDEVS